MTVSGTAEAEARIEQFLAMAEASVAHVCRQGASVHFMVEGPSPAIEYLERIQLAMFQRGVALKVLMLPSMKHEEKTTLGYYFTMLEGT